MQALLQKLADLDSDAERGVRVIEFFDQLVLHSADLESIVRATAVLADTTVGAVDDRLGAACLVDRHGRQLVPAGPSTSALVQDVLVDGDSVGRVWLERHSESGEWDDLIVDRMALTVATVQNRLLSSMSSSTLGLSDPAVVQLLLRPEIDEAERSRAVRLLGFAPGQVVNVVALVADQNIEDGLAHCRGVVSAKTERRVVAAMLTDKLAVLVAASGSSPLEDVVLSAGVTACVSDSVHVEACATAWQGVRKGVRFAGLGPRWPQWQSLRALGALVLLADLPPSAVHALPDVAAMGAVSTRRGGQVDLRLIEAVCNSASVREAASTMHLHHSSAAYRLNAIQNILGYDVRTGEGRYRAQTALLLWQLNAEPIGPSAEAAGRIGKEAGVERSRHRLSQPSVA